MPKAFARIHAQELEDALNNGELPEILVQKLREAIALAKGDSETGEEPIQVFIISPNEEDED